MWVFKTGILVFAALLHCSNGSPRIVGGQDGTIEQFPFLAQLEQRNGNSEEFVYYCTGALVTYTRLVTAAHCFDGLYNNQPSRWRIRVGATKLGNDEGQAYSFEPTNIQVHTEYNIQTFDNDIAVVTWQFPLWPSSTVSLINLNEAAVPEYSQVTIAGWGGIGDNITKSLQSVNVPTVELPVCRFNYAWHSRFVTDNMMCAGIAGRGSCIDDSGLPLVYNGLLAGISSWRLGCGVANQPGVFTVVLSSNTWLQTALGL